MKQAVIKQDAVVLVTAGPTANGRAKALIRQMNGRQVISLLDENDVEQVRIEVLKEDS